MFVKSLMRMTILSNRLEIIRRSLSESIEICMRGILWQFVYLRRINNVLYGSQGLYQILIPT